MELTQKQILEFEKNGYLTINDVFTEEEVGDMKDSTERLQEIANSLEGTEMYHGSRFVVSNNELGKQIERVVWAGAVEPVLLKYGQDKRLTSITSKILGSDEIYHIINQIHFKLPHDGVSYEFHQDSQNRQYGTDDWEDVNSKGSFLQIVTAIDESTMHNGPLHVIPESHNLGHLDIPKYEMEERGKLFRFKDAKPVLLKPGSIAIFGPYVIHGSQPNESEKPRRIFINGFSYPGANKYEYPGCGIGVKIKIDK